MCLVNTTVGCGWLRGYRQDTVPVEEALGNRSTSVRCSTCGHFHVRALRPQGPASKLPLIAKDFPSWDILSAVVAESLTIARPRSNSRSNWGQTSHCANPESTQHLMTVVSRTGSVSNPLNQQLSQWHRALYHNVKPDSEPSCLRDHAV